MAEENVSSLEEMQLHACIQTARETIARLLEAGIKKCTTPYESYEEDLVRANLMLAACYIHMAFKERGKVRKALGAKLVSIFKALEGYQGSRELSLHLITGYALMVSPSKAQEADNLFAGILGQKSNHILALIGRGCLAFDRKDYKESLGYFKSVLMADPQGPADVRVGIAHCFWRMGDLERAQRFFELALEQNKRCQNALLGMAILKLNQRDPRPYKKGVRLLNEAFKIDKQHPVILNILASYYYSIDDHQTVLTLAGNAMKLTDIPELLSHIYYQVARSHHATGEFEIASTYYKNALRLAPETFVLPQMGKAQMYLRVGEFEKAKICLEAFLQSLPNEPNALQLLGRIHLNEMSKEPRNELPEKDSSEARNSSGKMLKDVEKDIGQESKEATGESSRKRASSQQLDGNGWMVSKKKK
ncbi:RNA polymerase-associated protein CTR9 homolog isoform X2 [Drosophila biarmipes]|uniref:RNA polymerase-associated protein CTR9 homolog isoform X2 n=1 Tax=Drosophila biarmipes TaxID=125945 RepID=UPI0007E776CD|nr:RNA polymerase-associated protein CTR9 homolog isoform X2 [Drosophila biarmipes]